MDLYFVIRDDAKESKTSAVIFDKIKEYARSNAHRKFPRGEVTISALQNILEIIESEEDMYHHKTIPMSGLVKLKVMEYLGMEDDTFDIKLKDY